MKRLLFAATMLATLFVSCMKSEIEVVTVISSSEEFTAMFEDATRTELDGTAVVWNENDLLTIFTKTSHNRKYEIKSLSTDCRTATFSYVGFTGTDGTKITTNYALYPYDAEATLANGIITTECASEQTYDAETGNLSYALMTAASETTNFTFANAGALLRFKLSKIVPDDFTLRGIKLTSATQNIAGEITIDLNGNKRAVVTDNGVDSITLEAIDTEITLDVQEFYVAMPAMSFNKGDLSVTFMFDEGNKEFALPAFELAQGSIKNIDYTIKDAEEFTGSTPGDTPTNNEIWYTNGSTTEATTPNRTNVFGANILSNTYDAEKECWVIKFGGDVTTIGSSAFWGCSGLTSVTIPDSVTTIGYGAFFDCTSLTSVTIPDSVTSIGESAFYNCRQLQEFKGKFASEDGRYLIIEGVLVSFAPAGLTEYAIPNSVTTIGVCAFSECSGLTSVTIPNSVTTIGNSAFNGCSGLTSVTIPDSVTTIGHGAFGGCSGLTSVTIPNSVTTIGDSAFSFCYTLTSVTIPDSVITIGNEAFLCCNSITSVTIPNSVTTIGAYAFSGCRMLQEFKGKFASEDGRYLIIEGVLNSFAPAGITEYTIPDSVTTIGSHAFSFCYSLQSITIPDSVTTIGDCAFLKCFSLTSVYCEATTPPTGDYYMFRDNASDRKIYVPLDSVEAYKSAEYWSEYASDIVGYDFATDETLQPANNEIWYTNGSTTVATTPNKTDVFGANILSNTYDAEKECWVIKFDGDVTTIGKHAFYECSSLTSVTIPDSVTTIGMYAFFFCDSLTSVTIGNSVTTIGNCAFAGCSMLQEFKGKFASEDGRCLIIEGVLNSFAPAGLTEYAIPDSVTTIGGAFYNCSSLTSVTIPNGVTTIGNFAFAFCYGLTSVTIPDSVTTIGARAFSDCSSLTSVTIPESVTSIGDQAFYVCSSLTSVTIDNSVTTIGNCAFEGCRMLQEFKGKFASEDGRYLIIEGVLVSFAPAGITEYTIPDGVTTIGKHAFRECYNLTSVTIPDSVTTIGNSAFEDCIGLTSVYCEATTPPTGDSSMFGENAPDRKIYVPRNSVEAYKSAEYWSEYASDIVGYDFDNGVVVE